MTAPRRCRLAPVLLAASLGPALLLGCATTPGGAAARETGDGNAVAEGAPRPSQGVPSAPPVRRVALDPALADAARREVAAAYDSADPILKSQAIEATQRAIDGSRAGAAPVDPAVARDRVLAAMRSRQAQVRFAGAMAAGDLQIREAHPLALGLADDPDARVRVAARFALHRLGDTRRSHDLENMSRDPSSNVRGDVALALGLLGDRSALNVLVPMQNDPNPVVRLQVAEALWRLGDRRGLESLVAASISAVEQDRLVALRALAEPRDPAVQGHLIGQLTEENGPAVNLVAARALGMVGSDAGYGIAAAGARSRDGLQRGLAALAFGEIGRADAQPYLAPLVADPDPAVRLAAAAAVLRLQG